jgi:PKD domain
MTARAGHLIGSGRGVLLVLALALIAAFAAAPAHAAPTWLAASKLSATGFDAEQPQVRTNSHGDAVAVWVRNGVVEAAGRQAGGAAWTAAVPISNKAEKSEQPVVALDAGGDAVAAWLSVEGLEASIQYSTRTGLAGTWQTPKTLKELGMLELGQPGPNVAVDARGDGVIGWRSKKVLETSSRTAGGSFQTQETLSEEAETMGAPELGIDSAGDETADWEQNSGVIVIDAARRAAGGKWGPPEEISPPNGVNVPSVAVDSRGDAVAIWEHTFEEGGTGTMEEHIEAATRPAGAAKWGPPAVLTRTETGKGEAGNQQVAIDAQGDAVVIWERMVKAQETVEASEDRASSSTFSPPVAVSRGAGVREGGPQVAVSEQGGALVLWERFDGKNDLIEASSGVATSTAWQPPVPISALGQNAREPAVALDAQGNAAAVWARFDGTSYVAEGAGFDAAGPLLDALSIPTAGGVGQALAFSASPFDVWSALGVTTWTFGDGASALGASVTHAYATPGTYTVTVTGTDALGNATTATAPVSITAPGGKPLAIAPKITGAHLTHSRFRVTNRATAISARTKAKSKPRAPLGTSFLFSLNEPASLKIVFNHSVNGLRRGKRCVAPSPTLRRKHAKRCKRTVTVGTLVRARENSGPGIVVFTGRIGKKALATGSYRAMLTASADGLSSAPTQLSLTIAR